MPLPSITLRKLIYGSAAVVFSLWLIIYLVFHLRSWSPPQERFQEYLTERCIIDTDLLRATGVNITLDTQYARLDITVVQSDEVDPYLGELDVSLPGFQFIDLDVDRPAQECKSNSVTIRAPALPPIPNASHILFGVATTLERLEDSLDAFAFWASGTSTTILAVIEPHWDAGIMERRASQLGFQLTIVESNEDFLPRYFSLIKLLFQHQRPETEWVGLIDDDTFFPSMTNLISRLSGYDARKPQYIGSLSEDFAQMNTWGFMAYGGGGIFLSVPLLRMLNENDVYDQCAAIKDTGDRRLAQCIYRHTNTKLTWIPDLRQLDLHGDMSGFYESGRDLPLSLHHWKEWYPVNVTAMSAVASVCGDECLLRRWRLAGGWFLVNGFSIIKYSTPPTIEDLHLHSMEKTWSDSEYMRSGEGFMHSLDPLRPKDEGKTSFRLQYATRDTSSVRQFYIRQPSDADPVDQNQLVEVVWRRVT